MKPFLSVTGVLVALALALAVASTALAAPPQPVEHQEVTVCRDNDLVILYQSRYYDHLKKSYGPWRTIRREVIKDGCVPKLESPVADSYGARLDFEWANGSQGVNLTGRFEAVGIGKGYSTCLTTAGQAICVAFAATEVFQPNGSWFEIYFTPAGSWKTTRLLVINDNPCPWRPHYTCFSLGPNQELTALVALPNETHLTR